MPDINFAYWILQTLAMGLTCWLIPNLRVTNPLGALATVIVLAFINSTVWDAALFLNIPDAITYQTATLFLTNGLIFWAVVKIMPGIEVKGFFPALIAPIVFTVCSLLIDKFAAEVDWHKVIEVSMEFIRNLREALSDANIANEMSNNIVSE